MTGLRPCSQCRRHVTVDERVCPFCETTLPATSPPQPLFGRLSRAAVFTGATLASAAACGGKKKQEPTTTDPPVAQTDAGVIEQTEQTQPAPVQQPESSPAKMPYGAPPARRRIV